MLTKERIIYLLDRLDRDHIIHVKEIAEELDVSQSTIRRDLTELENQGKLKRVHGGAIKGSVSEIVSRRRERSTPEAARDDPAAVRALCKAAADLVEDGECIFLDSGVLPAGMTEFLANRPVRIVTNNHLVISRLNDPKAQVIVIGGDYISRYAMSGGAMALHDISQFQFDRSFLECAGLDLERGMTYTSDLESRDIKEHAMNASAASYLLQSGSRIQSGGFCKLQPVSRFSKIFVTDQEKLPVLPANFEVVQV